VCYYSCYRTGQRCDLVRYKCDGDVYYSEVEQYFNISVYEVSLEKELDVLLVVCLIGEG